jgi:hypothetical protein
MHLEILRYAQDDKFVNTLQKWPKPVAMLLATNSTRLIANECYTWNINPKFGLVLSFILTGLGFAILKRCSAGYIVYYDLARILYFVKYRIILSGRLLQS